MYLKNLEIHGFKSFANKLVFEFHDGITAIVGPNGSGKSNVGDAVRWVLGEQSAKQLRGAKMEDIIFSGTEARKPLGSAFVAITLDNSDHQLSTPYEEVTVARRVYRSGESEYLINGKTSRLKDVQELFLDTGIGKEGYSIIGQGQIDKILSGKPEERRELFDEAAGIMKFKKRKAQAERNLEEEKQNLFRITDILREVEKQVAPLEKQSQVAKEYLKLRDQLKILDVNMFLLEYDKIHLEMKELDDKILIAQRELLDAKKSYEDTKNEYEKLDIQIEEYDGELDGKKNQLSESRIKKEQLEGQIKVLEEQIISSRQNDNHYKERIQIAQKTLESKKQEIITYEMEEENIERNIGQVQQMQGESQVKLQEMSDRIKENSKEIELCKAEVLKLSKEASDIVSKLQRIETILEQNNIKKVTLNQRLLKNKSEEAVYEEAIVKGEQALEEISGMLQETEATNMEIQQEMGTIDEEISTCSKELDHNQQQYHKEKSRLDSLKNMTERYEGYGQSIRRVMEQKERIPGIHGVVADIIKVSKAYETAIETALGGTIQNIVTDHEGTAKQLIEYLKKNKYGRATFLPLTSMVDRTTFHQNGALGEEGVIGLASTLVMVEPMYQGLINNLLGRILVVDHIDHGISLAKKYHYSLRIVTVDGELLNPGGSMSGGAFKNSSNLLSRHREMEELEKQIHILEDNSTAFRKNMDGLKARKQSLQEVLQENKGLMQKLFLEQNTEKIKYDQAVTGKESNQVALLDISRENVQMEEEIRDMNQTISSLTLLLEDNKKRNTEIENQMEDLVIQLDKVQKEENNLKEKLSQVRLDISTLEQSKHFVIENRKRVQEDSFKLDQEIGELVESIKKTGFQVQERAENISNVKETIDNFVEYIIKLEEEIGSLQDVKEKITKEQKKFFVKREELSTRKNNLDKECFRLDNQKEKITDSLEGHMNYMWNEYELTYTSACDLRNEDLPQLPQMKKSVGELKNKIKNLGDVNVNAIEDYKNLVERFELLQTQHDDLIKSEEILKGIIAELDEEMRKQFEEKFQAIKLQFDLVFKELFGGGKGTLELMEGEDVLEAGIRIIAQPPGKKLQNMMQLSGGEKALTAISLLFAIQNLKPSPFCLLDEIEAALDDSNVKRYAKYLHKLTNNTQFIVITHRRGTMAAADILYGITMQEKGVSTLVSVNLIENELEK